MVKSSADANAKQLAPGVEKKHLERIALLRSSPPDYRLNNGPFKVLHIAALFAFVYFTVTHVPLAPLLDGTLPANLTSLEGSISAPFVQQAALDALDGSVEEVEGGDAALPEAPAEEEEQQEEDVPQIWEPETPQDYVKVVWTVICILHALVNLFCIWIVRVKIFCQYRRVPTLALADSVLVTPHQYHGKEEVVPIERRLLQTADKQQVKLTEFEYRKMRFELNVEEAEFQKVRFPTRLPIASYFESQGITTDAAALAALEKWGPNRVDVPMPKFLDLLQHQMLAPFFCFQVFCVLLWCLDEFWYYSLFTLFMLVTFESTVVFQRIRSLSELRALQTPKQHVQVYRSGKWELVPGEMLLPGDLFSLCRAHAGAGQPNDEAAVCPADVVLVGGTCICDEAVLTGESTPQWKDPILDGNAASPEASGPLDIKRDKLHVCFGGTKVLQHAAATGKGLVKTPDGGALAVVLRTGYETAQGRLMRTILFSSDHVSANTLETGLFICFLLIFAVCASGYVLYWGLQEPPEKRSRFKLFLNCTMILTSVIPPELPMELTMAVNTSLIALMKKAIFCTEPFRIPYAGKTEVCCFDKTGTLTSDNMVLLGLAGLGGDMTPHLEPTSAKWPMEPTLVMATCQTLMAVDGDLVGDPLEKASFLATGWSLDGGAIVAPAKKTRATHVAKFHFSSELKRMSIIMRLEHSGSPSYWVVAKGAPEVMRRHMADCPPGYDELHRSYAADGARVIALATRRLPDGMTLSQLKGLSRDEVETGLSFVALATFETPLKEGSEPALRMLKESSHQLVMITGDAPLTACHAARKVHILDRPVLILTCSEAGATTTGHEEVDPGDEAFTWRSPDDETVLPFSRAPAALVQLASEHDVCVTGDGLAHCQKAGVGDLISALTQVFARVSPDQKEYVLKAHRAAGRISFMCGDGTNDVGALKAAHVGIALMEPPAKEKVIQAMQARKEQQQKKVKEAQDMLRGIAPPPKPTTNASGEMLAGQKLIQQFEDQGKPVPPSVAKWAKWLDEQDAGGADGTLPMLKPGDASMASPFTVKAHDVLPCCDIIKQGRCTLVITVQMFKILGLLCLSTAYSLSVLYLAGVKLGDVQATCQGMLSAGMFYFISTAKPLATLSPVRPHPNVFSRYVMSSLLLQFAVQITFLIYMYNRAIANMDPGHKLGQDAPFSPNLVNTVCWIVQNAMQLITFGVNYVGEPFQTPLSQNKGMLSSMRWGLLGLTVLASGFSPYLCDKVQLTDVPTMLRFELFAGAALVFMLSYTIEHSLRTLLPARIPPQKGYLEYLHLLEPTAALAAAKKLH